jgi:hypothetical protein
MFGEFISFAGPQIKKINHLRGNCGSADFPEVAEFAAQFGVS